MSKRTLLLIISFLLFIIFAAPMIYISYHLSIGTHIIPDLERGYSINLNLIELILAIIVCIAQVIIFRMLVNERI